MIQSQLLSMNTLLAATILKVGTSKSMLSPGIIINNHFTSPEVVMTLLQQMSTHADAMVSIIRTLKNEPQEIQEQPKNHFKGITLGGLLLVSSLFIGICIFKQLRSGKQLL
jgi:hypothetical protein